VSAPKSSGQAGRGSDSQNRRPLGWRPFRWTIAVAIALFVAGVRWLIAAHVHIGQWAAGVPTTPGGYVFILIAIALLIAPDAQSISLGGFKLEMLRETKAQIEKVDERVHELQVQQAAAAAAAAAATGNQIIINGRQADALKGSTAAATSVAAGEAAGSVSDGQQAWTDATDLLVGSNTNPAHIDHRQSLNVGSGS
jgi:hypothetical protein